MSPRLQKIRFVLANVVAISVGILVGSLIKTYAIPKNVIHRVAFWVAAMALGGMASTAAAEHTRREFDATHDAIQEVRDIINTA